MKVKGIRSFLGWGWVTDPETKKSLVVRCQCPSQGQANMPPLSCEDTPPPRCFVSSSAGLTPLSPLSLLLAADDSEDVHFGSAIKSSSVL